MVTASNSQRTVRGNESRLGAQVTQQRVGLGEHLAIDCHRRHLTVGVRAYSAQRAFASTRRTRKKGNGKKFAKQI